MAAANDDLPFDDDEAGDDADLAELAAVGRFARMVKNVSWFAALGEPLGADEVDDARAYADALGFPDAGVAEVADWGEAETLAQSPDWNTEWWETEEQQRAALTAAALERMTKDDFLMALTHVTASASDVVHGAAAVAAARAGISDEGLIRAAAGAATQACYQAALVLAADAGEDHAFAIKFRLFEAGRWPLGIVGNTMGVF
jgi:hypothetical protein